jgi:hypothetical protein
MRRDGCTELWKHEEGWLYRNIEAWGEMSVQNTEALGGMSVHKYGSMSRDGYTEI